ncbi:MAG: arylamine N-acetyltransferase [Chlorobaculum sp.]|nr:arylamine N-acetyltransferase [Chlorobaculum sp.]
MKAANFILQNYLSRIGFEGDPSPDFETLKRLMRCQLCSVPFENLDVQAGIVPSLSPEAIYTKIVERRRGGYCYEVNGIFAMALEALGISYRFVAARPMTYAVRRPKTHVAIIASIDGAECLCDLGFGGYGIREPIDLRWLDREIRQDYDTFMLTMASGRDYLLQSFIDGERKNLYEFNLCPQEWVDFEPANWLNATYPESIFVQGLIVVLQHPTGKSILSGERFRYVSEGRVEEKMVSEEEVADLLRRRFSLDCRA